MSLRDVGIRGAGLYIARQVVTFAPVLIPLAILATPESDFSSDVLQTLSRLGNFTYAFGSAVLLFVLAGYAVTSINFGFYCYDSSEELNTAWKESGPAPTTSEKRARRYRLAFSLSLIVNFAALLVFWLLVGLTLGDLMHLDLLAIGRVVAVVVFLLFALGDAALCKAQSERRTVVEKSTAVQIRQRELALLDNDVSLSGLSVFLIDIPALAVAILALISIHFMHVNPGYTKFYDYFGPHLVPRSLSHETFELAIYGLEAGILATTLLSTQLIFAFLMARWRLRAAEIETMIWQVPSTAAANAARAPQQQHQGRRKGRK